MKRIASMGWAGALLLAGVIGAPGCGNGSGGGGSGGGSSTSTTSTGMCDTTKCWPQCFLDILTDCTPSGACTQSSTASSNGVTVDACYANGVKLHSLVSGTSNHLDYYKVDGTICFTADSTISGSDETATYKDPNGNLLVTVTTTLSDPNNEAVTCGGSTTMVDLNACAACPSPGGTTGQCTDGACTAP